MITYHKMKNKISISRLEVLKSSMKLKGGFSPIISNTIFRSVAIADNNRGGNCTKGCGGIVIKQKKKLNEYQKK